MDLPNNFEKIIKDPDLRKRTAFESHFMFFHIYFSHYVKYDTADFQKEMFGLTENPDVKNIVVVAFRDSGKSTIMNMSLPIWAIMGKLQCKYILIVGLTQEQAKQHLKNIRQELENNSLLKKDLGPFIEVENEWNSSSLVISKYGAKISAVSTEQGIRGTRHGEHRPDLIVCDDIEDMNSVKTLESRNKIDDFITSEVIPAGTKETKLVVIGNLLHDDSFIMRLSKRIKREEFDGVFRMYPLQDKNDKCLWPGKFPNQESIEDEKKRIGKESSWQREYMLRIVTDNDRIIHPEWIKTYPELPSEDICDASFRETMTGVDLAISQTERSDYTAMVSARVYGYKEDMLIYILPNPINERMTFRETLDTAMFIHEDKRSKIIVEDVAYQKVVIQELEEKGCWVEGYKPMGDKRARLSLVSHYIERGQVMFPEKGCKRLIKQLINFGSEAHDDLVDALVMLIARAAESEDQNFSIESSKCWVDEWDEPCTSIDYEN